jgi:hypothetical protein
MIVQYVRPQLSQIVTLVSIMIAAGVAGGYANFLLSESVEENPLTSNRGSGAKSLGLRGYPVIGVVAALSVPLFLSLVQSDQRRRELIEDAAHF